MKKIFLWALLFFSLVGTAQTVCLKVTDVLSKPLAGTTINLLNSEAIYTTSIDGGICLSGFGLNKIQMLIAAEGYESILTELSFTSQDTSWITIVLQQNTTILNEVVVTAQKRQELLQKLPVSISNISEHKISSLRLWNTGQLSAIVPNLYTANPGDRRNVTSIRGIVNTSYDPAVTTYIDGVNQFSLDTYMDNLYDVERIEVLRGPQGSLYGRNAMGGVINIVTKQPQNVLNGFAELGAGSYDQQRLSTGLRFPILKNKLYAGASLLYNGRHGFYTNDFNGQSFDDEKTFATNFYLRYLPVQKWNISLNVKTQYTTNDGAFPLVFGREAAFENPFHVNNNAVGRMHDNIFNASLSIQHQNKNVQLISQTAWQQNRRWYKDAIDGDFSPLDAVELFNNYGREWNNSRVFTQELRLQSPASADRKLRWLAGVWFFHQQAPTKQSTNFGADAALIGVPDVDFSTTITSKANNTGAAFFTQLNFQLTKNLVITGGFRVDFEKRKMTAAAYYQKKGEDVLTIQPDTSNSTSFDALSPKLGIAYSVRPSSLLFASISRGFRTGGLTPLGSDPSQPPFIAYRPEYSMCMEAGIKNSFLQNKLTANLTMFLTRTSDVQLPTLVLPDAITVIKNTGSLRTSGFETEVNLVPLKGVLVEYNFGYTNSRYDSLNLPDGSTVSNLKGNKQIFTPSYTSFAALQYSFEFDARQQVRASLRFECMSLGKQYFDLSNAIEQPAYTLLNTRASILYKKTELSFWARNLGNRKYIVFAYDFGGVRLGDPFNLGVSVVARF